MAVQHQVSDSFQLHVESCGEKLATAIPKTSHDLSSHHKWLSSLISRTALDHDFRVQALRFIDVLPSLDDDQALAEHLQEYFAGTELPRFAEWGLKHSDNPWATRIAAPTVRYTLRGLARKFMGGSQLHHALTSISRLRHKNINFTLDLLGEATISETESIQYQQQYLHMLNSLSESVKHWHHQPLLDTSHGEDSPRLNLSIKLSSLYSQIHNVAPEFSIYQILKKLRPILRSAIESNAFLTIDMEQYDLKNIVIECFKILIMEDEFKDWPHIGLAMQAYLKDTYDDILQLLDYLKPRPAPVTVRLVRGAYWDYETVTAKQNNWPCPVWLNKSDTDLNYEQCLQLLLTSHHIVHTAIATHNPRSIAYAMALTEQLQLRADQFEFQMLYGMADELKIALVKLNYRLRAYVPFGETLPGMAYLVRRLLENSTGQSLLDSGFSNNNALLTKDNFQSPTSDQAPLKLHAINSNEFKNTPVTRFTDKKHHQHFQIELTNVQQKLGRSYPLIINGKEILSDETITSINPSTPSQIIGYVSKASHSHADLALDSAVTAFPDWSKTSVQQRADYLRRVANLLNTRRLGFSAWQIFEAGKNWQEADADICEAIDFLNYYALQAEKISTGQTINISGESNYINYRPRGVCLVIPPWNFPIAIMCGMLSAAIVTGNTCILKPSSLTPVISALFMELWQEVNLPAGVINFLPGSGKKIGEYLAGKPDINIISFTGSQQVGTHLLNIGSHIQPGQHHIKKVIAEMGGKNSIIVDSDADLDDAVVGVIQSAFGFQGQKCSATSRVIVVKKIYDRFLTRLIESCNSLKIGAPLNPENIYGPVIDETSYSRIIRFIEHAKQNATLLTDNYLHKDKDGFFISPCIFTNVDPESPLAQEEIFGPVLAVLKADSFFDAIKIANNTRYALTGGVYSRQPSHLEYARIHMQAGNIYLNRKTTGAFVSRQPFGGYKMSGAGSKAGGETYLLEFMDAYCISENTLRRGFAPD